MFKVVPTIVKNKNNIHIYNLYFITHNKKYNERPTQYIYIGMYYLNGVIGLQRFVATPQVHLMVFAS